MIPAQFRPIDGVSTTNAVMDGTSKTLTSVAAPAVGNCFARFTNVGNQTVFIAFGGGAAAVADHMPLVAQDSILIPIGPGATTSVRAIGTAGSTLYVTVGRIVD